MRERLRVGWGGGGGVSRGVGGGMVRGQYWHMVRYGWCALIEAYFSGGQLFVFMETRLSKRGSGCSKVSCMVLVGPFVLA